MNRLAVSRRRMLALVGASVVVVPVVASARESRSLPSQSEAETGGRQDASGLVAPLRPGSRLGAWRVQALSTVRHGAVTVGLVDGLGGSFCLDICARDEGVGAAVAPGRSEHYDVFLANEGKGADPTHEDHGLAAMALAEIVRANENAVRPEGMLTLRERLDRYSNEIVRSV